MSVSIFEYNRDEFESKLNAHRNAPLDIWCALGYCDYPRFEYIKSMNLTMGKRTQANIKAVINPENYEISFKPAYKKNFSKEEVECMLNEAAKFMYVMSKYAYHPAPGGTQ